MIENTFKQIEPEDECPSHLKNDLISEIEVIRNALQVIELYASDLFRVLSVLVNP